MQSHAFADLIGNQVLVDSADINILNVALSQVVALSQELHCLPWRFTIAAAIVLALQIVMAMAGLKCLRRRAHLSPEGAAKP